ncbi:uncharacterized protein LOC113282062 [Papaver somniferum]|uniref:uncharacterized protein LOC113282062 n=1 Tax=Papaver somniferum TaxID=3469 RepID=UPI000E6FC94E|nr:uncharacterized protein LOC113282062 [Papaver somniferum]
MESSSSCWNKFCFLRGKKQIMNKKRKTQGTGEKQENPEKRLICSRSTATAATTTSIAELPPEVIYEILTRISVAPLLSHCRLVCKEWERLTYNSEFKLIHSQRTPTISGYLIQISNPREEHFSFVSLVNQSPALPSPTLDFLPGHVEILSSSSPHGLLSCVSYSKQAGTSYYICKPSTGESRKIPSPKTNQYLTLKTAIVVKKSSSPMHYNIIRFSTSPGYLVYHCEIFDSESWEWIMLDNIIVGSDDDQFKPSSFLGSATDPGILIHGAIHWLSYDGHITALDTNIYGGSWRTISQPNEKLEDAGGWGVEKKLVECEGEVGLLYLELFEKWLELWVLEDYSSTDETKWCKTYRVDLGLTNLGLLGSGKILLDLYTKHIILMKIENDIIWYDCKTGTKTVALQLQPGFSVLQVHQIYSDLLNCFL